LLSRHVGVACRLIHRLSAVKPIPLQQGVSGALQCEHIPSCLTISTSAAHDVLRLTSHSQWFACKQLTVTAPMQTTLRDHRESPECGVLLLTTHKAANSTWWICGR
jgi:hypothetical protein